MKAGERVLLLPTHPRATQIGTVLNAAPPLATVRLDHTLEVTEATEEQMRLLEPARIPYSPKAKRC